jgi:hypothetical protein
MTNVGDLRASAVLFEFDILSFNCNVIAKLANPAIDSLNQITLTLVRQTPTCQTIKRYGYTLFISNISYIININYFLSTIAFSYSSPASSILFIEPIDPMTIPNIFASSTHGV